MEFSQEIVRLPRTWLVAGALLGASLVVNTTELHAQHPTPRPSGGFAVGASLLTSAGSDRSPSREFPSLRLEIDRALSYDIVVHAGFMRSVTTANMFHVAAVGASRRVPMRAFELRPFAELIVGSGRAIADSGGYHYAVGGSSAYQPRMRHVSGASVGAGAGMAGLVRVNDSFSLEVRAAHWRTSRPGGGPAIQHTKVGAGVHVPLGRRRHSDLGVLAPADRGSDQATSTNDNDNTEAQTP